MASKKGFTAKSMFADIGKGPDYVLTGVAKEKDGDVSVVMFSENGDCTHWIEIDENLIKSFDFHGRVPCGDHSHPLVTLHLVEPASSETSIFAQARRRGADLSNLTAGRLTGRLAAGPSTDCIYDTLLRRWINPRTGQFCD